MGEVKKPSVYVSIVTGCISGGIESVAVWPMEYIKTQLQLQRKLPAGQAPAFTGITSGLVHTVRTTGFFSLYNGLGVTLVGSIPKAGRLFSTLIYNHHHHQPPIKFPFSLYDMNIQHTLHYLTLPYITLHYIELHYIILYYIALLYYRNSVRRECIL